MIKDIEINNFRCFDQLKVSGFKRVNLISGNNNVGKTALLEAILLNNKPTKDTIILINVLRGELYKYKSKLNNKIWDELVFNKNLDYSLLINSVSQDKVTKKVGISIYKKINFIKILETIKPNPKPRTIDDLDRWLVKCCKRWIEIQQIMSGDKEEYLGLITIELGSESIYNVINLSVEGDILLKNMSVGTKKSLYFHESSFIPSSIRSSRVELVSEFDKARLKDRDDEVLSAFQIIDPSIVAVESLSIPKPTIYLKRQGEKRIPLSLFGDAMNRIADIILKVINNRDSVLLIDEIENGIHHSNQVAFWEFLYKLADRLNVQIFATTHSLEMTEAFIKAGLDRQDSAAHFELVRHEKTNKIVAINRDLETLEYGISHHKEVRGGA
jgi:AAA domain, putative AbiEii toxin, Type IV TA system